MHEAFDLPANIRTNSNIKSFESSDVATKDINWSVKKASRSN